MRSLDHGNNSYNSCIDLLRRQATWLSIRRHLIHNSDCWSVPWAVKSHRRSLLFNRRWPPLRKRRIRLVTACFLRSECFELHKILRAQRKEQFSVLAKFITALTTISQRLALLDVRGRLSPLVQCRNLERWTTAASPYLPRRWLNVAQTLGER